MTSAFPGALDTLATDKVGSTAQGPTDHPQHHDDLADAVNKIEAALGVNVTKAVGARRFGYKTGEYFFLGDQQGTVVNQASWANVNVATFVPMAVGYAGSFDRIGIYHTASTTATVRFALYDVDFATGRPTGTPIQDFGSIGPVGAAAGWIEAAISPAIALSRRVYYLASVQQTALVSVKSFTSFPVGSLYSNLTPGNNNGQPYTVSGVSGAFGDVTSATFATANGAAIPLIQWRAA